MLKKHFLFYPQATTGCDTVTYYTVHCVNRVADGGWGAGHSSSEPNMQFNLKTVL